MAFFKKKEDELGVQTAADASVVATEQANAQAEEEARKAEEEARKAAEAAAAKAEAANKRAQEMGKQRTIAEYSKGVGYEVVERGQYAAKPGQNPAIAEQINKANAEGRLKHGQSTFGVTNQIVVDYSTIKTPKQAAYFGLAVPEADREKYAKQYAEATGQDVKSVIAQFETITGDTFFSTPKSDGAKVRAGNSAMNDIGLYGVSGSLIDANTATTAEFIRAAQMDPNPATGKSVYKIAKAMAKVPGSIWYGMELEESMFSPVASADLKLDDGKTYKSWLNDVDGSFTYSDGFTDENLGAYLDYYEEITDTYADNPRVMGYMLRDLKASYEQHTRVYAPGDAEADQILAKWKEEKAAKELAGSEADESSSGFVDWMKGLGESTLRFLLGMGDKQKTPEGTTVVKKGVDEIAAEIEAGKETPETPAESETPKTVGRVGNIPGGTMLASATVSDVMQPGAYHLGGYRPNSIIRTPDGSELPFNQLGLDEEYLNQHKAGNVQGPVYISPEERLKQEADLAEAWGNRRQGMELTAEQQKALAPYNNPETLGVLYGGSYAKGEGYRPYGDVMTFGEDAIAGRLKYGKTLGGLATKLSASSLKGDARYTAEIAIMDLQRKIYERASDPKADYDWASAGENMYEYVLQQNDDLVKEAASILRSLEDAETAHADAAAKAKADEEARYKTQQQQWLMGQRSVEAMDAMAAHYAYDTADVTADELRNKFIAQLSVNGDLMGDNGTFWQGNSATAQEAARIRSVPGGMQGFMNYRDDVCATTEALIDDYTNAALNMGLTLEQYLSSAGITDVTQLIDIARDMNRSFGNALLDDPDTAAILDAANQASGGTTVAVMTDETLYDITGGEAASTGWELGGERRKESFYQTSYMIVDEATYLANVDSIITDYTQRYGFDGMAEVMYRRDLEELMASGKLSDEMVFELKKNMAYANSIFDLGYVVDPDGLMGFLREGRAEAGKKVELLEGVVARLIPEDRELVNAVAGFRENLQGMGAQAVYYGLATATGLGAFATLLSSTMAYGFNTYADAYDANMRNENMDPTTAGRMAFLEAGAVTAVNLGGAGSFGDLLFGNIAWDGVEAAFRAGGGKGWLSLMKYLGLNVTNEGTEEVFELATEKLFDLLDQEAIAMQNGEGFSVSRTFGRVLEAVDPETADYAEIAKEIKQAFGGGVGYSMIFTLLGAGVRMPGVKKGAKMYNSYSSVKLATDLFDGKTEISDESIGKVYSALAKDLEDPKFRKWLDSSGSTAMQSRAGATAVLSGVGSAELDAANKTAQLAEEYDKKVKAGEEAVAAANEMYDDLTTQVAEGKTDLIPEMQAAQTALSRDNQFLAEVKAARDKAKQDLSASVKAWMQAVREGGDVIKSDEMRYRMEHIAATRDKMAAQIVDAEKRAAAKQAVLDEMKAAANAEGEKMAAAEAKAGEEAAMAESAVFGDAEAEGMTDTPEAEAIEETETADLILDAMEANESLADAQMTGDADTIAEVEKNMTSVLGKAEKKLVSLLKKAYDVYHNSGSPEYYQEVAQEYNDAIAQLNEAGIKIKDGLKPLPAMKNEAMAQAQANIEQMSKGLDQETNAPEPSTDTRPQKPKTEIEAKAAEQTGGENAPEPSTESAPARPAADMTKYKSGVRSEVEETADTQAKADEEAKTAFEEELEDVYAAGTKDDRDAAAAEMKAAEELARRGKAKEKQEKNAAFKARVSERATDIVTGTTKAERDAKAAEVQAEKNVAAMDVEAYIEQEHKDAPEEDKNAIRKLFDEVRGETPLKVTADVYQFAARVGKKFGVEIELVESLDGESRGEITGNKIKIARDATQGDVVKAVIVHELMHKAEGAGKLYDKLQKMILDMKYGGDQAAMDKDIDQKVTDYTAYYKAKKRTDAFTKEDAKMEIVADYMGEILNGNQEMIDRLVADDPTFAQRIMEIIRSAIDKLRGVSDPQLEQMKKTVKLFERALKKADAVSGVKYSKANEADAETEHIKDQIRDSQDRLNQMSVAAKVTAPDTSGWSSAKRNKWVMDSLKEIGMHIDRQGFGTVILDENQISYGLKYVNSPAELYAVLAVPKVIKRGIEIHGHENHKYRGFPTVTFAAPVEINGVRGNMGVVVKLMDKKRYKTHRILLPDGSAFIFDNRKAEPTTAQGVAPKSPFASHISSATDIISENASADNSNSENPNKKYSLPSDNALKASIRAWMKEHQAEMDAAAKNSDSRSQQADTLQRNPLPDPVKRVINDSAIFNGYKADTNEDQYNRAMAKVEENGYQKEVKRLLDADDFSLDDSVEAGLLEIAAFETENINDGFALIAKNIATRREAAQIVQAAKMFTQMSPSHVMAIVAGDIEKKLTELEKDYGPLLDEVRKMAKENGVKIESLRGGDELARLNEQGSFTVKADNKWGVPLSPKKAELIKMYGLENVERPGIHYNKATKQQRMLEAILTATTDPDQKMGNGRTLLEMLELIKRGKPAVTEADLRYIADQIRKFVQYAGQDLKNKDDRDARVALSRAMEAYGNMTPATLGEQFRVQRYVNMLLSVPSALRNVIGNVAQFAVNTVTHDTLGTLIDYAVSKKTGKRENAYIDGKARSDAWHAFRDGFVEAWKDAFVDRTNASGQFGGAPKFGDNERGRTFQRIPLVGGIPIIGNFLADLPENARTLEGFLMSFGDRMVYRSAFASSIAEQTALTKKNGVELNWDAAVEQAKQDANYAIFNEASKTRSWLESSKRSGPLAKFFIDANMPFIGIPLNIGKRGFWDYSPVGGLEALGKAGKNALEGKAFNQKDFVDGLSRGLGGGGLMLLGVAMAAAGVYMPGTGEDDDEKLYNLRAAQGHQYTPYIRWGDEYYSLAVLAPVIYPITLGATIYNIATTEDKALGDMILNAGEAMLNQFFDASFMSGLAELFDTSGGGSIGENIMTKVPGNMLGQLMPYGTLLGQMADMADPYVRDTKDASAIREIFNKSIINKLPEAREYLLEPKYDITGKPFESKDGAWSFVDPLTHSAANDDPVLTDLDRIAEETGSTSHIPSYLIKRSGKITILKDIADDRKVKMDRGAGEHQLVLTAKERSRYNRLYSQLVFEGTGGTKYKGYGGADTSFTGIRELMESSRYQKMSDEDKAAEISAILSKAKMLTQSQIVIDKGYGR